MADWLIEHLRRLQIEPAIDGYRQRFRLGRGPTANSETANIIAMIPGTDETLRKQHIIIGAHMDHAGTLQRGYTCSRGAPGDDICNGADDNGSGTIAVLNVAKALSKVRHTLKRSILIMFFSGEEEGLIGSSYYVRNPVVPLNDTVYMINLDMVGYMKSFKNRLAALGGGSSPVGRRVLETLSGKYDGIQLAISDRAGGGSDHAPFMAKGIPGVFFHTGVKNNPNYHRTSDHVDKIDFAGMTVATKVAFETVYRIANTDELSSIPVGESRPPLVTDEELQQSCHHLIKNPFTQDMYLELDFTNGNDGRPSQGQP